MKLYKGDCLEVMKTIKDNSIDAIITDPPYGTTACKWDSVIDFDLMWEQLNRIIKPNGAIVLFGSEPFSSALRMSNINNYKYDWVWDKKVSGSPMLAKKQPMKIHELISVFNSKIYYPIMQEKNQSTIKRQKRNTGNVPIRTDLFTMDRVLNKNDYCYPKSIQKFTKEQNNQYKKQVFHPTQKPLLLMEYLIKTYTLEGETVLDFTMGSGSTGVACKNTNRKFIGIEMDDNYFDIASERINNG
jgi:site-specific DNA-methyltransferase (adenine-specific)